MKSKQLNETKQKGAADNLQSGSWEECYRLAEHLYAQGDYQEAFSWYMKASALPHCNPIVFFELGYLFQHGEGVDSDNIEAHKWYEKAASLGVPQAMYNLAYFYQNGLVVDKDIQKAARLLRDATSIMDRLQLERDSYDAWKADYDEQLAEVERDAKEKRERSERLELRNHELNTELLDVRQECQRLEQDAIQIKCMLQESEKQCMALATRADSAEDALQKEQEVRKETECTASVRQTQMEERLRSSEELITNLVKVHNESFERVQSSCVTQIDHLKNAYKTDFAALQKANEQLRERNIDLSQTLNGKILELNGLQETIQQFQIRFEQERKKKRVAFLLTGIFGFLALILLL